jgi:hypothetical protein
VGVNSNLGLGLELPDIGPNRSWAKMLKSPIEIGLGFDQVKSPIPFLLFFFSSFFSFLLFTPFYLLTAPILVYFDFWPCGLATLTFQLSHLFSFLFFPEQLLRFLLLFSFVSSFLSCSGPFPCKAFYLIDLLCFLFSIRERDAAAA